jgi:hypothetical protein
MHHLLLIVEPKGQRASRTLEEGQAAYAVMLEYAQALQAEGVLLGYGSLLDEDQGLRLQHREGRLHCIDGPFTETKEMIGGYFLVDCVDREAALALAARCPAADWATVEVRPMGPCWVRGAPSAQVASA